MNWLLLTLTSSAGTLLENGKAEIQFYTILIPDIRSLNSVALWKGLLLRQPLSEKLTKKLWQQIVTTKCDYKMSVQIVTTDCYNKAEQNKLYF